MRRKTVLISIRRYKNTKTQSIKKEQLAKGLKKTVLILQTLKRKNLDRD